MQWPSKTIPHGGILHAQKSKYSPETHKFIKVLLEESKLTAQHRKQINYHLRNGDSLPLLTSKTVPEKKHKKEFSRAGRPGSSKRRSRNTIIVSGAYERQQFVPLERKDREKEKLRLQEKMAHGKEITLKIGKEKCTDEKKVEVNRFDELVEEIKEREGFLQEMERLGEAVEHKLAIQQQIQAKVREMETL